MIKTIKKLFKRKSTNYWCVLMVSANNLASEQLDELHKEINKIYCAGSCGAIIDFGMTFPHNNYFYIKTNNYNKLNRIMDNYPNFKFDFICDNAQTSNECHLYLRYNELDLRIKKIENKELV